MLIDRYKVSKAIANRISYNNTAHEDFAELSPCLVSQDADYNVNSVSGLVTIENIDVTSSYFDVYPYPTWKAGTYAKGDVVKASDDLHYQATKELSTDPTVVVTDWHPMTDIDLHLHTSLLNAANKAINTVYNGKKIRKAVKTPMQNIPLFDGICHRDDKFTNANDFVGFRVVPNQSNNLTVFANKLTIQFSAPVDFSLYVYHTSQDLPVQIIPISYTKSNSVQFFDIDLAFNYVNLEAGIIGGSYTIGYKQSEIEASGVQALRMDNLDFVSGHNGCVSCGNRSRIYYQNYSPYVSVETIRIAESELGVSDEIFDYRGVALGVEENYGMNLWLNAECSFTDSVLDQPELYTEATANVAALEHLRTMAHNTNTADELANKLKAEASKEVVIFDDVVGNIADVTKQSLEALSFDLSNLDPVCLKCDDRESNPLLGVISLS